MRLAVLTLAAAAAAATFTAAPAHAGCFQYPSPLGGENCRIPHDCVYYPATHQIRCEVGR